MVLNKDEDECIDYCRNTWRGFESQLIIKDYDYVFILGGTNDMAIHTTAARIVANLKDLAVTCLERGIKNVGLLTIPACGAESSDKQRMDIRKEVNILLSSTAQVLTGAEEKYGEEVLKPHRCFAVDAASELPNDDSHLHLWDRDRLHLSEEGSRTLAKIVFETMQAKP